MESSVLVWITHAHYSGIVDIFRWVRIVVDYLKLGLLFFKTGDSVILIKATVMAKGIISVSVKTAEGGGDGN